MSLRALLYAYVLGGLTFIPLVIFTFICITIYTSVPVPDPHTTRNAKPHAPERSDHDRPRALSDSASEPPCDVNDLPRTRKGWLTVRRTFEESSSDGSYVTLVKSYLDSRSKDPKRSRPKDTWYVVLKGKVMYLYEDEGMTECEAAVELGGHDVVVYPEGLLDGELFTRRNAICLKPRSKGAEKSMSSVSKEMASGDGEQNEKADGDHAGNREQDEKSREVALEEAFVAPWFIFVRSCVDMEDWYLALVHASDHPSGTPMLSPLKPVFLPSEMNYLVATLDEQPDVIPMRWFNALLGRVFYSFYRTQMLESYIIGRLMKKLSKVKRTTFLADVAVTQFSVGNKAPTFSKPMLKELTKEGDASLEVGLLYKGEIRATVEATAVINLGARFKSYTVKLVLAVVLRELEGNLLIKVKRPPSSRVWYAFTKPPRMVVNVEPIVSDRQITWSMILNTIEAKIEEIITDSVVLPNMDDISFFDSVEYEHRGGLWADAVRLDKPMAAPAPEVVTKPSVDVVGSEPLQGTVPSTVACAQSEEEPATETPSLYSIPIIRSVTTSSEKTSTATRRRSWFSSGADTELDAREVEEVVRGRRERSAEHDSSLTLPPDTPTIHPSDVSDDNRDAHEYLSPRSSSAHSRSSRAPSLSSSAGGDEPSNYLSDTSATSKSLRHPMGTSTTSSFLSTLKSKAGDKQALSNTAKEAMRKWGVWGLKKDNGGSPSLDDLPDVGPSDHLPRTENTQGRQSYADMRAAVIERRGREPSEKSNGSASPIPIPQGSGREKGRSPSLSGSRVASYSSGSTSPGLSRSLGDNVSDDPLKDRDFTEAAEEKPAPSLIHTQPSQARAMTIPGIHASHRGEVMSMGNVAPVSPALETKLKGPTIQSMYRLWKSPILTGQPSQEAQPSSSTSPGRGDTDENHDVVPLSLTPEVTSPPLRPVPPPLPPRTISSVAVRHEATTADDSPIVSPVSAASRALKSIASRDETRRLSVEINIPMDGESSAPLGVSEVTSTAVPTTNRDRKPPLPPRRIPV
ncbi:hypothetical protein J3R83DRAFT_6210 [Lanmaoa asiatica]|nr:hypothetical protein J3R83DRAFT_6210 [Lanmaoa asiatica]